MEENLTYEEAFDELDGIVTDIERGEITVSELSKKVKRAVALIGVCKKKLTTTEEDVKSILKELEEKGEGNNT